MVVAYGTAKKSSFTGSASVVKGDELQKRVTGNITKSIEGTVAGLQVTSGGGQPGEGASIMIRGIGSINAVSRRHCHHNQERQRRAFGHQLQGQRRSSLSFPQTVRPRRHRRFHRTDLRVPQEQRAVQHGNGFRGCERIRRDEPRPNHRRSQES